MARAGSRRFVFVASPLLTILCVVGHLSAQGAASSQADDGYHVHLLKPVAELRASALRAMPPAEMGEFRQADFVELAKIDPAIHLDLRYATSDNVMGVPLYTEARAFLQRPAAEALHRVSARLKPWGYGLLVYDAYRPWYVTKMMWDGTPNNKKSFVAKPSVGSRHNRGCAVDVTLYVLATGASVAMPSGYDEMSERASPAYAGGTAEEREHRDLLRHTMAAEGFTVFKSEWWHFDYKDWQHYRVANVGFAEIEGR
jgi:zinc D-Ala-D-Ala dipeptidase